MRAGRTTAALLLAGSVVALPALTGFSAPIALADSGGSSFEFSVTPDTVAPGESVTLRATGCASQASASAPTLFDDVTLPRGGGSGRSATVRVGSDARPGAQYDITFLCGSEEGTTPLMIGADRSGVTSSAPSGAVQTGLGGGVSGPDSIEIVAGVALIGAVGVYIVRRRAARN